ncbi:hypothetical protein PT974_03522 [Cladobotryum mycophilum]|uniref:Arrestin-like N-terminal domain-containing protein n=1 Tax=Cladobotryum mycophilum TaxID=491253 RepID=A0ABR0SSK0_9HYPO
MIPADLRLKLTGDRNKTGYLPGDRLEGVVTRWMPMTDIMTVITVTLYAKAKTMVTNRVPPKIWSTYRSKVNILGTLGHQMVVYRRPVATDAIPTKPTRWEFAFQIPNSMRKVDVIEGDAQAWTFLGEDREEASLPASFFHTHHSLSKIGLGHVEYYLEAVLFDSRGKTSKATTPVTIGSRTATLTLGKIQAGVRFHRDATVASQRLLGSGEAANVSHETKDKTKIKTKSVFSSSAIPQCFYHLHIRTPAILQLGNPQYIPFTVRAHIGKDETTPDLPHHGLIVKGFNLYIDQLSKLVARKKSKEYKCTEKKEDKDRDKSPVVLPLASTPDHPVNIGRSFNVLLRNTSTLRESYTAPNLIVYHELRWELTLSLAGEERTFRGSNVVLLRGPTNPDAISAAVSAVSSR